jgi:hypothetical protein
VLDAARLMEAPVAVALHRYVEGIVPVSRQWPLDVRRNDAPDPVANERRETQSRRLDTFLERATTEGLLRDDLAEGWARRVLDQLVDSVAHDLPRLDPPQAADLVVATFLDGVGRP